MRQVSLHSGDIEVLDVPVPICPEAGVLVRARSSVISLGTEGAQVAIGRSSLFH